MSLLVTWLASPLKILHFISAVYVPVDATVGSASLSIMIMTSGTKAYHWRIRATQIDCKATPELVGMEKHAL
jgi:phage tail sheath gpL-like